MLTIMKYRNNKIHILKLYIYLINICKIYYNRNCLYFLKSK